MLVTQGIEVITEKDYPVHVSGHPARPHREQMKRQAHLGRIPKLVKRVERLEAVVAELSGETQP